MKDIYNHLRAFGLAKKGDVKRRLDKLPEKRLERFLESYIDVASKRPIAIEADPGATDIYPDSWSAQTPLSIIKQLSIYSNRIYIHDPLVKAALDWPHVDSPQNVIEAHSREERLENFIDTLADEIEELLELQPLVKADIVYLSPTDLLYPRREPNTIYADDFFSVDGPMDDRVEPLPPNYLKYYAERMMVSPARYIDNRATAVTGEPLAPQRMIAMGFPGDPIKNFFHLFDVYPHDDADDREGHYVKMHFNQHDTFNPPVEPEMFWNWVESKKRQVATERYQHLTQDLVLASKVGARFITDLHTSDELARLNLGAVADDEGEKAIRGVLNMDLPFFYDVNLNAIVSARQNEVAFEEFRSALDKAFKAIKEEPNSPMFQKRVDEITRDLLSVPIAKVDQQMGILKRNTLMTGILGIGTLSAAILAQQNTLFAVAAITAGTKLLDAYKQKKEQEDKVKQLPGYFYWKVTKKAR